MEQIHWFKSLISTRLRKIFTILFLVSLLASLLFPPCVIHADIYESSGNKHVELFNGYHFFLSRPPYAVDTYWTYLVDFSRLGIQIASLSLVYLLTMLFTKQRE